jgi:hypothetical protein
MIKIAIIKGLRNKKGDIFDKFYLRCCILIIQIKIILYT